MEARLTDPLILLPLRTQNLRIELNIRHEPMVLRKILKVLPDLRGVGVEGRPIGVGLKAERVGVRRDVARASWIAVLVPGHKSISLEGCDTDGNGSIPCTADCWVSGALDVVSILVCLEREEG